MPVTKIAERYLTDAIADAKDAGLDPDSLCRAMLGLVVAQYLESRSVADVQSELRFIADNCDPETEFAFIRPF
jgi:hypothetical protein